MLTSNSITRRPIEDVDWKTLPGLMGVPQHHSEHFIWWLISCVESEWRRSEWRPKKSAGLERNADIARTGRAYIRAIKQQPSLTRSDRKIIKSIHEHLQHVWVRPRGAPKRISDIAVFLKSMLKMTWALGGHVSFNRKTGKGNVIDLLDKLRAPVMPVGFIPNAPPMSAIERLSTNSREWWDGLGADEAQRFVKTVIESWWEDDDDVSVEVPNKVQHIGLDAFRVFVGPWSEDDVVCPIAFRSPWGASPILAEMLVGLARSLKLTPATDTVAMFVGAVFFDFIEPVRLQTVAGGRPHGAVLLSLSAINRR